MTEAVRSRSGSFMVSLPLAEAVPLFTAEGERRWVKGWDPEILSGNGERGSAFVTHAADGRRTTWIVAQADAAAGRLSYARLVEGLNIGLIEVSCLKWWCRLDVLMCTLSASSSMRSGDAKFAFSHVIAWATG